MIEWQRVNLRQDQWPNPHAYTYGVTSVLINDQNEEYCHNNGDWTTKNTEIFVDKGKSNLVIAVGDSWTHGEGAPEISHREHRWDPKDRIEIPYGSKIARILDADYWIFSRPGNSNTGIFTGLFRILNNIPVGKYKSIKVCVQMTDVARDRMDLIPKDHPLQKIYNYKSHVDVHISEWFRLYDEIFCDWLETEISKHSDLPLDVVLFKNFNKFQTTRRDYSFKICDYPWLKYHAYYCGVDLETTVAMNPKFYEHFIDYEFVKNTDKDWISSECDKWEKVCEFMLINNEVTQASHPTKLSQSLWATYLLDFMNWARPE